MATVEAKRAADEARRAADEARRMATVEAKRAADEARRITRSIQVTTQTTLLQLQTRHVSSVHWWELQAREFAAGVDSQLHHAWGTLHDRATEPLPAARRLMQRVRSKATRSLTSASLLAREPFGQLPSFITTELERRLRPRRLPSRFPLQELVVRPIRRALAWRRASNLVQSDDVADLSGTWRLEERIRMDDFLKEMGFSALQRAVVLKAGQVQVIAMRGAELKVLTRDVRGTSELVSAPLPPPLAAAAAAAAGRLAPPSRLSTLRRRATPRRICRGRSRTRLPLRPRMPHVPPTCPASAQPLPCALQVLPLGDPDGVVDSDGDGDVPICRAAFIEGGDLVITEREASSGDTVSICRRSLQPDGRLRVDVRKRNRRGDGFVSMRVVFTPVDE